MARTAIDLFCGAGGLSQGLKAAGFTVVAAVELDSIACEAYKLNHPRVQVVQRDIRRVTGPSLLRTSSLEKGELDLLAACPPCQGFSTMRSKNGRKRIRDSKNDLLFDVLRLTRSMRPRSLMLENVPGLAKSSKFRTLLRELHSLGYRSTWSVLNTKHYGVPQSRRRLILMACIGDAPQFADGATRLRTVRDAIGHLPHPRRSRDPLHNYKQTRTITVSKRIAAIPKNGGSRSSLRGRLGLECHKGTDGFHDVYGRMHWNSPSPTITGGCINPSKGRFVHPSQNRAITIREAALLQTFPRGYRLPIDRGRFAMALLVGNALPPEFIRRHARRLLRALNVKH